MGKSKQLELKLLLYQERSSLTEMDNVKLLTLFNYLHLHMPLIFHIIST